MIQTQARADRAWAAYQAVRDLRRRADLPAVVTDACQQAYDLLADVHHGGHGYGTYTSIIDVDALDAADAMARIAGIRPDDDLDAVAQTIDNAVAATRRVVG